MRNITGALGVRCQYCHLGEEGQPLSQFDFASDDKPTKRAARAMMEMVQAINGQHLARLAEREDPPVEVTCATCHRGVTVPRPLADLLGAAVAAGGADSAARAYRALRERYYGRSAYDFGEGTLVIVAGRLARERRFDDAVMIARLNIEFFPQSSQSVTGLGEVLRMRGDTTGAAAAYRQALQLNPNDQGARMRLRELGQQP
jgi:Flp pilus assembly protein TadD